MNQLIGRDIEELSLLKKGIFLKSTRKEQLKNVQDGISRPLGSREIQKTKAEQQIFS